MATRDYDMDDDKPDPKAGMRYEFECPSCDAHNPYNDGFKAGHEITCFYCGQEFKVLDSDGKPKFKEI